MTFYRNKRKPNTSMIFAFRNSYTEIARHDLFLFETAPDMEI